MTNLPLPLLITGVAGVAGYNALDYFRSRYPGQVIAIRQEDNWPLAGEGIIPCNAEDHGRLRALFDEYQFGSVLNCAGNCALRACELDTRLAWRTNVEGLINLLSIIVERNVRLVHLSIDLVFSGESASVPLLAATQRTLNEVQTLNAAQRHSTELQRAVPNSSVPLLASEKRLWNEGKTLLASQLHANELRRAVTHSVNEPTVTPQAVAHGSSYRFRYSESDPTDPVTVYGKTMVAAELLIADWLPAACVLRISLPMGVSFNGHAGAIDWIQSRFKKGRPATLYFDEIRTPAYTDCLNRLYERVLASDLAGLFHAGGPRALSLYEIAQVVNRVGGYDPKLLMGGPRVEAGPIPPRAGNVTMNSRALAEALGHDPLDPWPHDPALAPTHRDWHHERHGEPGSRELLQRVLYRNPRREEFLTLRKRG
jgi:dTDP-4-dehydrorhamnose reductase